MHDSSSLGSHLALRLRYGFTLNLPASLRCTTTYVALEQEAWFESEVDFVRSYLRPGDCAVDVGANFGVYTTALAAAVGQSGKVFAFEPAALTATYLRSSIAINKLPQAVVVQAALSDHGGQARLNIGESPEESALIPEAELSTETSEFVELLRLDDFLSAQTAPPVSLLKIDAEGHELSVGHGARETILRHDPLVLFEIKHDSTPEFGFMDFLGQLGLAIYRLAPGLNLLVPFDRNRAVDGRQLNLFACSAHRAQLLHARGLLARRSECDNVDPGLAPFRYPQLPLLFPAGELPPANSAGGALIAHYGSAFSPMLSADERLAHLSQAFCLAQLACAEKSTPARQLTRARITADLGYVALAADLYRRTAEAIFGGKQTTLDEPFLTPRDWSPVDSGALTVAGLRIAVLETLERTNTFSSAFAGPQALPLLEHICADPLCSPEMHRRRQLLRMRKGLQSRPEPHPALIHQSARNLNAWFWSSS